MLAIKIGLLGGMATTVLSSVIGQAAAEIVAITAALTALGWVWTKMILPAAKTFQRTHAAVGALEDLGDFMVDTRQAVHAAELSAARAEAKAGAVDMQLELIERRLDLIERHIGLFAAEDAVRARAAMVAVVERNRPDG